MSEKVLITPEQAEAIERWANKEQLIIAKASGLLEHGMDEPIAELTMKQLVKAIYIGYEVEPEFKVGDWITWFEKDIGVVLEIRENGDIKTDIKDEKHGANQVFGAGNIRHATPEEIAEEKERRWWREHGREVWELRKGDMLIAHKKPFIIWEQEGKLFAGLDRVDHESPKMLRRVFKVVCFAEDRLDGDFDE